MLENKNSKDKVCAFYASDYHFEMMTLPYISKKLDESKKVVILSENDLNDTINVLMERTNLKTDKKEKILNLNWNNNDLEKFRTISENVKNKEETVIFVKGKENYINNVNKNLEKWLENGMNSKVINCYDIQEIGGEMNKILDNYGTILSTSGEKILNNCKKSDITIE